MEFQDFRRAQEFEAFLKLLLTHIGYRATQIEGFDGDVAGTDAEGQTIIINAHFSRSTVLPLSVVRDLATSTKISLGRHDRSVVATTSYCAPEHRSWINAEFGVEVWDRAVLYQLAPTHLRSSLDDIVAEQVQESTSDLQANEQLAPAEPSQADMLIETLTSTPPGKPGAKMFETVCQDVIAYLFGDDLVDARPQNRIEDDLNILDITYRVRNRHSFWNTLTRDFRARVIVIECKNYTESVGASQVFSTERYLNVGGLRPICFLISRKPPSPQAELAAYGAMRESGKLFVFLSDTDLIQMIKLRSAQLRCGPEEMAENDPAILLDQKIYQFLATIGR